MNEKEYVLEKTRADLPLTPGMVALTLEETFTKLFALAGGRVVWTVPVKGDRIINSRGKLFTTPYDWSPVDGCRWVFKSAPEPDKYEAWCEKAAETITRMIEEPTFKSRQEILAKVLLEMPPGKGGGE